MRNGIVCIRGLPGSGKSTLAWRLLRKHTHGCMVADDDYFMQRGYYMFVPSELSEARAMCQQRTLLSAIRGPVFVHNTFSTEEELVPYAKIAVYCGVRFNIIDLFDDDRTDEELAARNVHGAPVHVIARMRERWFKLETKFLQP